MSGWNQGHGPDLSGRDYGDKDAPGCERRQQSMSCNRAQTTRMSDSGAPCSVPSEGVSNAKRIG